MDELLLVLAVTVASLSGAAARPAFDYYQAWRLRRRSPLVVPELPAVIERRANQQIAIDLRRLRDRAAERYERSVRASMPGGRQRRLLSILRKREADLVEGRARFRGE